MYVVSHGIRFGIIAFSNTKSPSGTEGSGTAECLRAGSPPRFAAQDRSADFALRESALQAMVRQGNLSGIGAAPRHGVPSPGNVMQKRSLRESLLSAYEAASSR